MEASLVDRGGVPDPPPDAGQALERRAKIEASRVARAARRRSVLQLAAAGASHEDIAEQIDATPATVARIIRTFVKKMDGLDLLQADAVRQQQLDRLDRMLLAVWQKASEGNLKAVDRVIAIEKFRAQLAGTERPRRTSLDVSGKVEHVVDDSELARLEQAFRNAHPDIVEGDFVELDATQGLDETPELPPGSPS